jgi:hypothetical protein
MNKMFYRTLIVLTMFLLMFPNVTQVSADGPTPPPPPPSVEVSQVTDAQITTVGKPVRMGKVQLQQLLSKLKLKKYAAADATVSAYAAAVTDGSSNARNSFTVGQTMRYVGTVSNTTGSSKTFYAWWYESTPCGSYWMWSGWLTAATGNPGWYLQTIASCPGSHSFTFWTWYNNVYTSKTVSFTVSNGGCAVPTGQFCGEYYNNRTLSGNPAFTQNTSSINFDWGNGGPGNGLSSDNFSIRWQGVFSFDNATYTFSTSDDDGVRLYVDNNLQIDAWKDQAVTTYTKDVPLSSGNHTIKIEYYENSGGAVAKASWQKKATINIEAARAALRAMNSMKSPWGQVDAPLKNNSSSRSQDWYAAVIDQFDVASSSFSGRYSYGGAGLNATRCNIFAGDVVRAMGASLPKKGDVGHGASGSQWTDPMTANATDLNSFLNGTLHSNDPANGGWSRIDATTAQGLAQLIAHVNSGQPAVASTSGHIAVIRPGQATNITSWKDLRIAQAGASLFLNGTLWSGFGSQPQFFIHQ